MHISWARLASFCHLGFISDPLIVSKFHNETHDPKGQENKIYIIVKTGETLACRNSSGTLPRAKNSLKVSVSFGEISLHDSFSTLVFSPSGLGALCTLSLSNRLASPFGSTVMSPTGENGLAPLEGGSESPSRVKADWNCLLHIMAFHLYICPKNSVFSE